MRIIKLLLGLMAIMLLVGCSQAQNAELKEYNQLEQLDGKRIGVWSSSFFTLLFRSPESPVHNISLQTYKTYSDLCLALQNQKIDVIVADQPIAQIMTKENDGFAFWEKTGINYEYVFAFPSTPEGMTLKMEMDDFLQKIQADGTWKNLQENYLSPQAQKIPEQKTQKGRTLNFAVNAVLRPFAYFFDGEITGYEVALASEFCQAYGYKLNLQNMDFGGTITAVVTGKCDFSASCIGVTELKKEQVYFSQPIYRGEASVVYLKPNLPQQASYWQEFKNDVYKSFVLENRWKIILQGLGITALIGFGAGIGGTILGSFWVFLQRKYRKVLSRPIKIFMKTIKGMPILILLMILYYIVFASSRLGGITIVIIGFSLNFSVHVANILNFSIDSVDSGQWKAAWALGYNQVQTFKRIIFPQAMKFFLPLYNDNLINMIKSTSVVGYLAIVDLTKAADIIRDMTYEPFLPLLLTPLIYFGLSWILFKLLVKLETKISSYRQNRILKGISVDD